MWAAHSSSFAAKLFSSPLSHQAFGRSVTSWCVLLCCPVFNTHVLSDSPKVVQYFQVIVNMFGVDCPFQQMHGCVQSLSESHCAKCLSERFDNLVMPSASLSTCHSDCRVAFAMSIHNSQPLLLGGRQLVAAAQPQLREFAGWPAEVKQEHQPNGRAASPQAGQAIGAWPQEIRRPACCEVAPTTSGVAPTWADSLDCHQFVEGAELQLHEIAGGSAQIEPTRRGRAPTPPRARGMWPQEVALMAAESEDLVLHLPQHEGAVGTAASSLRPPAVRPGEQSLVSSGAIRFQWNIHLHIHAHAPKRRRVAEAAPEPRSGGGLPDELGPTQLWGPSLQISPTLPMQHPQIPHSSR